MEKEIRLNNDAEAKGLFGRHDENLKLIEGAFKIQTLFREGILKISGEKPNIEKAARVIEEFLTTIREGGVLRKHDVSYAISAIKKNQNLALHDIYLDKIKVSSKRLYVTPKSKGQKEYVDAIRKYDIVFAIGPAGTGKTYLSMAMAVNALNKRLF